MKKILLIVVAAVLGFASCTKALEDRVSKLEDSVETIQKQIAELTEKLNSEVGALQKLIDALENKVYVTGVSNIMEGDKIIGYTITLSKGPAITIYHGTDGKNGSNGINGNHGVTPKIGVVLVDGVYYWTVNGEILTDADGNKIPVYAESDAPQFKYEDGKWWISTDGKTWSALVSSSENTGDSLFSDVAYDDTTVTIVLKDGTEIVLPRACAFRLEVDKTQMAVLAGATVKVGYKVTGASETTVVYAVADGGWAVKVEGDSAEGNLLITAPSPLTDGKVVVFAGDNTKAAMQVITFEEGALTLVSDTYNVDQKGGVVEVPVVTNLDYKVEISADWINYTETKAMREETLVFTVEENKGPERTALVCLTVDGAAVQTITVTQATAAEPQFALEDIYGSWKVTYGSGSSSYEWQFFESDDLSKGNIRLDNIFGKSGYPVYGTFDLYTGVLTIQLRQKCMDNFGYQSWLCTKEGTSSISYTFHEDMTFDSGTATLAYAYYETSDPLSSSYLTDAVGVKKDENALEVGNYYYSDGTCKSTYDSSKTLVGIVFWVGNATANDPILKAAFPECKNGLAMAVNPVNNIAWQTNTASIAEWQAANLSGYTSIQVNYAVNATNLDKELGYSNTQVLKAYNEANPETAADIYASLVEFAAATPAPAGTSGWYIPSAKEVSYMCYGPNTNAYYASGTTNLNALNTKIAAAGLSKITFGYLASSTEISATNAYAFQSSYLGNPSKTYNFTLCPVFAF